MLKTVHICVYEFHNKPLVLWLRSQKKILKLIYVTLKSDYDRRKCETKTIQNMELFPVGPGLCGTNMWSYIL